MKILIMSRIIGRTGVGNHIKQLSEELVRQGHSVWVVSSTNDMAIGTSGGVLFKQVELRSKNPITILKSLKKINQIIVENHIEIVHCHHRMAALFMHWYNIRWNIPYVYTLHASSIPHDLIHRMLTYYGNRAIAISHNVGNFLNENLNVPKEKISFVLNGVDDTLLKPVTIQEKKTLRVKFGISEDSVVIALHSRIEEVKNHLAVVEALQLLAEKDRSRLTLLCSGETNSSYFLQVQETIKNNHLEDYFVFCGWTSTHDVLGSADALLLPSKSEGFPLSCIEAFFMNIPVTRSQTGGYEEMKDYVVALENVSPETLAKHIHRIIEGTEYENDQVERAKDFVEKTCTIKAMTCNTVAVYQEALKDNNKC